MKNVASVSIFFLVGCLCTASAQIPPSGFYMLIAKSANCDNKVYSIGGDEGYCVPRDPIIPIDQFQSVRSLGAGQNFAVDVRLKPDGQKTMKKIAEFLPASTFLLVVDGSVVALFDTKGKSVSAMTENDLRWAEKHLAKLINN